jgi:hypothetical protein
MAVAARQRLADAGKQLPLEGTEDEIIVAVVLEALVVAAELLE